MSRKSGSDLGIIFVGIPIAIIFLVLDTINKYPAYSATIGCIIFLIIFYMYNERKKNKEKAISELVFQCHEMVDLHISELVIKNRQYILEGSYGEVINNKYIDELNYFISTIVYPKIQSQMAILGDPYLRGPFRETVLKIVSDKVQFHIAQNPKKFSERWPNDPIEFEHWCATQLQSVGWKTKQTSASGDQGADIVAIKEGRKLVVQCKFYSSAVGNKAVQEIVAAKVHYSAHLAAVVCVNGYTRSAKELAKTNGVILLDAAHLRYFD